VSLLVKTPSVWKERISWATAATDSCKRTGSRSMLERYNHIGSEAKPAAIQALGEGAIEPILQGTRHKMGPSDASED
jgi:hypothetical protein